MSASTPASDWTPRTLADILTFQARERDAHDAVVTETDRRNYRDLADDVWRTAKALHASGVKPGDFVGILMGNDTTWLTLFYAAATIGAITVPVNTRFKSAELAYCLKQADCSTFFLVDRFMKIDFCGFLREAEPAVDAQLPGNQLPKLRNVIVIGQDVPHAATGYASFLARGQSVSDAELRAVAAKVTPDDLLLIQFTSGTTAYPKGVMLTHNNMLRNAWAAGTRVGIRADDRYFNCRPFFHVAGSTLSALASLVFGAALVTLPSFEPGAALALMARERCTLTSGNDTIFQMLMGHPDFDRTKLALRGGWCAAGPETVRKIMDDLGASEVCVAYGLSESSPNVVMTDYRDPREVRIAGRARPLPGIEVRIADPATNVAVPVETQGEIQVRGWGLMRGYYNNPSANATVFTPDRWLRTGDLGVLDSDGRLRMVGRLKDVFRVGGENVAPAEVEEVLLAHAAVETAQVIGVPDPRLGEVAAGYVTLKAGAQATETELTEWCRTRMANFRVPRYLRIVADFDSIGMTASGKVQKTKLREHAVRDLGLSS